MRSPFESFSAKPQGATTGREQVPSKYELKQAETERVMEDARGQRAEFFKKVITSRTADIAGNLVPGLDIAKMTTEAAFGKTSSGEKLGARQRMSYAAIAGGIGLAYALELSGMSAGAVTARSAAAALAGMEFSPEILKGVAEKAKEKYPKAAHILERVSDFAADKREIFTKIGRGVKETLRQPRPETSY